LNNANFNIEFKAPTRNTGFTAESFQECRGFYWLRLASNEEGVLKYRRV